MRRREFVGGGLALAASSTGLSRQVSAQLAPVPVVERIIDAHCHIFNADDLPIQGFVTNIIIPRAARSNQLLARFQDYPGALQALVRALAVQMKSGAPDGASEIKKIDEIERDRRKFPTRRWRRSEDLKNVRGVFRRIWRDRDTFRNLSLGQTIALEVALENIQLFLVQQVHSQFGRPVLTPEERQILIDWPYEELAATLYTRNDLVGRYIRWALLFTRYRVELVEELDQVHQLADKHRIVMMTPASVDFSKWVEDDKHAGIEEQIKIASRLARRKSGPRVHGFVGFDPLRKALFDSGKRGREDKDPMVLLQSAIEAAPLGESGSPSDAGGSIGVKLYPPMGFRAMDNHELADSKFNLPNYLSSSDRGLGTQIGKKLDQALSGLYVWCSDKNVPIMTHTNNSFGPTPDYEVRAHPQYWGRVLRPDAHPNLRINMAHFGHFNNAVTQSDPKNHIGKCWEWTVGEVMSASTESYAYADISSIAEILKPGPSRKILECMQAFKESFRDSADRLIYGTDWSMIAQVENFPRVLSPQPYPDLMVKFLHVVGYSPGQIEGIMFRNATRFLGLSKSEHDKFGDNCSRGRLEKFYSAHNLSADWMTAFG